MRSCSRFGLLTLRPRRAFRPRSSKRYHRVLLPPNRWQYAGACQVDRFNLVLLDCPQTAASSAEGCLDDGDVLLGCAAADSDAREHLAIVVGQRNAAAHGAEAAAADRGERVERLARLHEREKVGRAHPDEARRCRPYARRSRARRAARRSCGAGAPGCRGRR